MMTLDRFLEEQITEALTLAVLSGSRRKEEPRTVRIRPLLMKGQVMYQASWTVDNKMFHRNYERPEALRFLTEELTQNYRQLQCRGTAIDGTVLVSKKGHMTFRTQGHEKAEPVRIQGHDRVKRYILAEGTPVPFLLDLGVMTGEGRVVKARYDKFRQINRFLEFIEDILPELPKDREAVILDFGCGKSYLTFAIYYYLKILKGYDIRIIGLDLKEDVIRTCNALAVKYGYDKLHFLCGDVADYEDVSQIDMMVTLHACDTATDYALAKAVQWQARVILSVPCCQHELNRQIRNEALAPVLKYGILKERMAALLTDGIRAELLTEEGNDTQILDFIDMEHTPKNLLIRAVRRPGGGKKSSSVRELTEILHVQPTLARLLEERYDR